MSRTFISSRTGKLLSGVSGNWECPILGRVTALMGTSHFYAVNRKFIDELDLKEGKQISPFWFWYEQPYKLDGLACKEFAKSLINVTDEVIDIIYPKTKTFEGSKKELKKEIQRQGKYYLRLKNGYECI